MEKQYGQYLKNKQATQGQLPWLTHPHSYEDFIGESVPDIALTPSVFALMFSGESVLLAQVLSRGWCLPGGHIERSETVQEAMVRELFEETGATPLIMGEIGYRKLQIHLDECPENHGYPFPISYQALYWGVVDENAMGAPSASMEVGEPRFFAPHKAKELDEIKVHQKFYEAALERARVAAQKLASF